jgi:hypothetical protein
MGMERMMNEAGGPGKDYPQAGEATPAPSDGGSGVAGPFVQIMFQLGVAVRPDKVAVGGVPLAFDRMASCRLPSPLSFRLVTL